jgi:hypothetical protein
MAPEFHNTDISIYSILISYGSKMPMNLHVQQSPPVVPLFWAQAVNRSEAIPVLLIVFSKVHLTGKNIKIFHVTHHVVYVINR